MKLTTVIGTNSFLYCLLTCFSKSKVIWEFICQKAFVSIHLHLQCGRSQFDSWVIRSPGEEIGYTLQYSWASLVPQLVKNLPAMRETCVPSLGLEDPLEKGKATHSRIPWTVHGVSKSWTWLSDSHFHTRRISAALSRGLRWYAYMALL